MTLRFLVGWLVVLGFLTFSGQPVVARTLAESILSDQYSPRDEYAAREDIMAAVQDSLWNRRFEELEAMADAFRTQKVRTPSGRWRLSLFYAGLSRFQESMPENAQSLVDAWIAAYPQSSAAHIGYAVMLLSEAWTLRGKGFASTVDDSAWEPFHATVEHARKYLMAHKALAAGDPHWYVAMAEIATIQGWPDAEFDALLREAFDREPSYTDTYFEATNRNLPKWGGNAEKVERFAREAVDRTKATEGFGLYARIYFSAWNSQYGEDLFEESAIDWTTMSKGIDDVLARYPSQWNINHFAYFACLAGDYGKALDLMERIEYQPMTHIWGGWLSYFRCKWWAELVAG